MINPTDTNISLYNLQGKKLEGLTQYSNLAGKDTNDEKLKKAANEFEAVFITKFLDIMESTVEKSDFLHGGQAEKTFKSMLNQQLALEMASSPRTSFGLAEQIYQQMKDKV